MKENNMREYAEFVFTDCDVSRGTGRIGKIRILTVGKKKPKKVVQLSFSYWDMENGKANFRIYRIDANEFLKIAGWINDRVCAEQDRPDGCV